MHVHGEMQLTGSKVVVAKGQYDQAVNVAPGSSVRVTITPPVGELWRIKTLYINVPAPVGAVAGTHAITLTKSPASISEYATLNANSNFGDIIRVMYNYVETATGTVKPASAEMQQRSIQSLVLTNDNPLVIYYSTAASIGATQTGTIRVSIEREVEYIV